MTSGDDPAEAREGEAEDVVGVLRARVVAMMSGRPEDVRLVLRSAEALMRAELTERRLRPPVRQELAENIQRVLDSLGSQLLPAEYPGGSPPDTK